MKRYGMVTFSGIDSSGKSTYIGILSDYLDKNDIKHKIIWSRGGYTSLFESLKKIVRGIGGKNLPVSGHSKKRDEMFQRSSVSNLWYTLAMLDLIRLYAATFRIYRIFGYVVICDRYIWDTYVDFCLQFSSRKLRGSILWRVLELVCRKPDISFFFEVTPEESLRRSTEKNELFSEPIDKRRQRTAIYQTLKKRNKWNICLSTQHKSIEETWHEVRRTVDDAFL